MKPVALILLLALAGCVQDAPLNPSGPNPQLALSVSQRLQPYGIDIAPEALNTRQAAALHALLVEEQLYIDIRREAENILSSPQFR